MHGCSSRCMNHFMLGQQGKGTSQLPPKADTHTTTTTSTTHSPHLCNGQTQRTEAAVGKVGDLVIHHRVDLRLVPRLGQHHLSRVAKGRKVTVSSHSWHCIATNFGHVEGGPGGK